MKKIIRLALLSIFLGKPLQAKTLNFQVGSSANYLNVNDPKFKYTDNQFQLSSINLGLMYQNDTPFVFGISTNRINKATNRQVANNNGTTFNLRSKTTNDVVSVGYQFKRFIPSLFVANVKDEKQLSRNNVEYPKQINHSFVYGLNGTYFINKELSVNLAILAPNKELNIETGAVLGFNYNFNLL